MDRPTMTTSYLTEKPAQATEIADQLDNESEGNANIVTCDNARVTGEVRYLLSRFSNR